MAIGGEGSADDFQARDVRRKLQGVPRDVAQLLYNLAKTARSFGFYARTNRAIARFLDELFDGFDAFLTANGVLRLGVGADRFTYGEHEVYHDPDRESGLPFRLYRDGIRAVTFKPGLTREELDQLLDVLAKRASTGRDAEEEDVVTMLWKLSFEHLTYQAVEGFTHDLHAGGGGGFEEGEDGAQAGEAGEALPKMMERISGARATLGGPARPPRAVKADGDVARGRVARSFVDRTEDGSVFDPLEAAERGASSAAVDLGDGEDLAVIRTFRPGLYQGPRDYPLALRGGLVEFDYQPITVQEISDLKTELAEDEERGLIHMLDYCFELCLSEPRYFDTGAFVPMIGPIRRYLVRNRRLGTLDVLLRYLRRVAQGGVYPDHLSRAAGEMLQECASQEALAGLVAAVSGDPEAEDMAWDVLQQLMPSLDDAQLLVLLGHGMSERMAAILAATVIRTAGTDVALYERALGGTDTPLALASLRCLATLRTPEAVGLVEGAVGWAEPAVRRAALRVLGRVPPSDTLTRALGKGLRDGNPEVRQEAIAAFDRQGLPELAPTLFHWFDTDGFPALEPQDRDIVVNLLASLDPDYAGRVLSEKLNLGLRAKVGGLGGDVAEWNRVVVEGLAAAGTEQAMSKLREVRTQGSAAFKEQVTRILLTAARREQA